MKKQIWSFAIIVLFACSNNSSGDAGKKVNEDNSSVTQKEYNNSGPGCSSFLWFKKGTTLEYKLTDATGASIGNSTTTIDDVRQDGGSMVADYTVSFASGKSVKGSYRCEGDKIYMDTKSFFQNNFSGLQKSGMEIEMQNGSVSFPSDMKVGDNLESTSFEADVKKNGKDFMKIFSEVKERNIDGKEKITTSGGSWNCFRLNEVRTTTTEVMGRKTPPVNTKSVSWFASGIGPVKFETYDATGNLASRSELISIK